MAPCSLRLANRHFLAASDPSTPCCTAWYHRIIGRIETIPVLGDLIAAVETMILRMFPCWAFRVGNGSPRTIQSAQPCLASDGWGHITLRVNGTLTRFKDAVIHPSGAGEWDWGWNRQSPMHHHPGVRIDDVDHFLSRCRERPEVIILTRGRGHGGGSDNPGPGILEIELNVEAHLRAKGFSEIHILKTAPALQMYEQCRAAGKKVLALVHTTC